MRRFTTTMVVALLGASLLVAAAPAPPAEAKPARLKCKPVTVGGKDFRFCQSAFAPQIKSADGTTRLDVDVTLPAKSKKPLGLIVMLHGLGGSKTSFELRAERDDKLKGPTAGSGGNYHMNHLWFASKGYAVLTYTARGFHESKCLDDLIESTDGDLDLYGPSPACRTQLDSIDHEIKDTQYLIGRLVDGTLVDDDSVKISRSRVGVVGGSYGGGHTWLLSRRNSFKSPKGIRIKIAAAVPIIGWTDLVDALTPNGRARDDFVPEPDAELRAAEVPGVLKHSFVGALYFSMLQTTGALLPGYLSAWKDNFDDGPPYNDAVSLDAIEKLLTKRSAYYIDKKGSFDTPILAIQGFTDTLFPAIESLRMVNGLIAENPDYPVKMYLGDIGHATQNKAAEVAHHNDLVLKWFNFYLRDKGTEPSHDVEARFQDCYSEELSPMYRGATWSDLTDMPEVPTAALGAGVLDTAVNDPHAGQINPVQLDADPTCPTTDIEVAEGNVAVDSEPLEDDYEMLGLPQATFKAIPTAGDLYVAMRLWDVDPETNEQILVTRGVYQLGASTELQDVSVQLFGNGWTFPAGHVIRLEITANDAPTMLKPGTGTIALSDIKLSVPQAVGEPVVTQTIPARTIRRIGKVSYGF